MAIITSFLVVAQAMIPLSSGVERTPQIHEFLIAMRLVEPAAISYFSAMNYHGLTEQLPRQVFIATNHKVTRTTRASSRISQRTEIKVAFTKSFC